MAKLKTERIVVVDSEDRRVAEVFNLDIMVSTKGYFYCTLPEEITKEMKLYGISLNRSSNGIDGYFENKDLEILINNVKEKAKQIFGRTLSKSELVIRYKVETDCLYAKDENGIFPNGTFVKGCNDSNWEKGNISEFGTRRSGKFSLSFSAKIFKKDTYKYLTGRESVEYSVEDFDKGTYGHKLNSFLCNYNKESFNKEEPYTEELAKFFCECLTFICRVNDKFSSLAIEELVQIGSQKMLE